MPFICQMFEFYWKVNICKEKFIMYLSITLDLWELLPMHNSNEIILHTIETII